MKSVADLRKEYSASGLEEAELPKDPFPLFRQWLEEAVNAQVRFACMPRLGHRLAD
jgi:pyridoxamine 5'-phosphate oxidase